jgi:lipopolysaccharide transport protein LptA
MKKLINMNRSTKSFTFLSLLFCLYFVAINACVAAEKPVSDNQTNIILKSDRSRMDGKTLIFEYCGNAILTQPGLELTADCLIGKKNKDGSYQSITAKGNPAFLTQTNLEKQEKLAVKANLIEYKIATQQFLILENAQLKITSEQDSLDISADKIELDNKLESSRDIAATGSPLQIELIKSGQTDLKAKSKKLHFNTQTSHLKLSEDVIANLELGQITAGIFNYNSETKVSSFDKSPGEQVKIIQTKKQP